MSIESIGAYSPDTIYGQLTMPFPNKPVTINAHTSYDNAVDEEQAFSKNGFYNNHPKEQVPIEDIREMKGLELDESITGNYLKEPGELLKSYKPNENILAFSSSKFQDSSGVVYEALRNGYTAQNSIVFGKAHQAYNKISEQFEDPVKYLSTINFQAG